MQHNSHVCMWRLWREWCMRGRPHASFLAWLHLGEFVHGNK